MANHVVIYNCEWLVSLELVDFKELITEAEESQFPDCELLDQLRSCVGEAEQCVQVASQLLAKKHKTRYFMFSYLCVFYFSTYKKEQQDAMLQSTWVVLWCKRISAFDLSLHKR